MQDEINPTKNNGSHKLTSVLVLTVGDLSSVFEHVHDVVELAEPRPSRPAASSTTRVIFLGHSFCEQVQALEFRLWYNNRATLFSAKVYASP